MHDRDTSYLVDAIAEEYWPNDPDRDSDEARGLKSYYEQADAMLNPSQGQLVALAASLPNTKGAWPDGDGIGWNDHLDVPRDVRDYS